MAVNLQSTANVRRDGVKMLVYGQAGAGKTTLIRTLPSPVIISAEGGLLSLSDVEIPFIQIATMDDLADAYRWAAESEEARGFESVAIDSLSEIAEVCLISEKRSAKDPRAAYGSMQDQIADVVRNFRDLPGRHVYMTAKVEQAQDELGRMLYAPGMPGKKTSQSLPYFFDEVFALRVERSDDGPQRMLQTQPDGLWYAKDRGGVLDAWEVCDLGVVIKKIGGVNV